VIELSQMISDLAPEHINMVFYVSSGSEANDTILRLVRTTGTEGQPEQEGGDHPQERLSRLDHGRHLARRHGGHARARAICRFPAFTISTSPTGSVKA
jgi:4-aminobutyrate aminotransferase-like enzyme